MIALYDPTPEAAAKTYAKLVGDHGHSGGWIHNERGQVLEQGWTNYSIRLRANKIIVPKEINGETRWAVVWHRGKATGLPVTCQHPACPRVCGGLRGVNA